MGTFSGTLSLNGEASLDPGNYLLLEGSPGDDPRQAAAIARDDIAQRGFEDGDSVVVTGNATKVGQRPAIWVQSIAAAQKAPASQADLALVRGMPPAKSSAKKATPKKKAAKRAAKKAAKKTAAKKRTARSAPKRVAKKVAKKSARTKSPKGRRK